MTDLAFYRSGVLNRRSRTVLNSRILLSQQVKIGVFSLMVIIIGMICLLSLLYLRHFNNVATKGYVLRKLESERISLIKQNEVNELQVSQARTLDAVRNSARVQGMIHLNPEKIVYVKLPAAIAKR